MIIPSELTGKFLDVLKEQICRLDIFMQGSNLQNTGFQENVKRAVKEGHYIGAHSMTHNSDKLYKRTICTGDERNVSSYP